MRDKKQKRIRERQENMAHGVVGPREQKRLDEEAARKERSEARERDQEDRG